MQYINVPPNLSMQLPHAAMWREISFAHSSWCGDACSKICTGPPDRPNQNSLPLSLRVASRKDHDDAMNSECHVFTTFTICVFSLGWCWLNISHNPIKQENQHLKVSDSPSICSIKSAKALGLLWITFFETESHIQWPPLGSASAGMMSTSIWTSLERDATKPNRPRLTETGTPGGKVHPVNCTAVLCQSSSKIVGETSASLKRSTKSISLAQSLPQSSILLMSGKWWNVRLGKRLGVWNDFGIQGHVG